MPLTFESRAELASRAIAGGCAIAATYCYIATRIDRDMLGSFLGDHSGELFTPILLVAGLTLLCRGIEWVADTDNEPLAKQIATAVPKALPILMITAIAAFELKTPQPISELTGDVAFGIGATILASHAVPRYISPLHRQ